MHAASVILLGEKRCLNFDIGEYLTITPLPFMVIVVVV